MSRDRTECRAHGPSLRGRPPSLGPTVPDRPQGVEGDLFGSGGCHSRKDGVPLDRPPVTLSPIRTIRVSGVLTPRVEVPTDSRGPGVKPGPSGLRRPVAIGTDTSETGQIRVTSFRYQDTDLRSDDRE